MSCSSGKFVYDSRGHEPWSGAGLAWIRSLVCRFWIDLDPQGLINLGPPIWSISCGRSLPSLGRQIRGASHRRIPYPEIGSCWSNEKHERQRWEAAAIGNARSDRHACSEPMEAEGANISNGTPRLTLGRIDAPMRQSASSSSHLPNGTPSPSSQPSAPPQRLSPAGSCSCL